MEQSWRNIGRDLRLVRLLSPKLVELWEYIESDIDDETGESTYPDEEIITEIVIRRVAGVLDRSDLVKNVKKLGDELLYRESQSSTVIGKGIAIPHVRSKNVRDLTMCFLRYPDGAPMKALDDIEIVHFVFGIVTPIYEGDTDYQKVYRKLLNIFITDSSFAEELIEMTDPGEIVRILKMRQA
ncbi:PTS sugar transporter subunit IIA [bacterium]|nr:PTS sugar transporter subunit IIA [bacterium]